MRSGGLRRQQAVNSSLFPFEIQTSGDEANILFIVLIIYMRPSSCPSNCPSDRWAVRSSFRPNCGHANKSRAD